MDEKEFKKEHRQDLCSTCPKRTPCGFADAICHLITPCALCKIKDKCGGLCKQIEAYLNRSNKKNLTTTSFNKSPRTEDFFSYLDFKNKEGGLIFLRIDPLLDFKIPWGALSERQQKIVKAHFYERKSYGEVAEEYKLSQREVYNIIRGNEHRQGALKKLEEYAIYQKLFEIFNESLSEEEATVIIDYYLNFKPLKTIWVHGKTARTIYRIFKKAKDKLQTLGESMKDEIKYIDTPTDLDLFIDLFDTLKKEFEIFKLDRTTMLKQGNHEFYFRNEDLSYIG